MDMFMIFLVVLLPFTTPGEPLFTVAGLSASKAGFLHALMILLKAHAVVLSLLALVGTLSATSLGHALAHLRVPDKLVHLLLFTVRYLDVIGQEYKRMRRAMQARAFVLRTDMHTWRSIGYLIGMLLVHSLERSERIMDAMKCRGYKGQFYLFDEMALSTHDYRFMALFIPFLCMLMGLNFL
jgi:cobalt/nickel transport system permease protein